LYNFCFPVNFFPHSVADLESTLGYLQRQNSQDFETWETRYSLLLWMTILVKIPFNLASVDSLFLANSGDTTSGATSLFTTLVSLAQRYLGDSGATRDMAAVLLAKLFSRADAQGSFLSQFLEWAVEKLTNHQTNQFLVQF
jgi:hypothetical protein